ncbi:hypothetical protein [Spectribacter hydrogenoxidans]|uniref:Uncharacterized protein n=1 Tax=Spectribacter hydrogenoxidans TaxID=3075608 RepID=A0ABU3C0E7_9GAMM|nr:hypothetical protein [Salinisphaera sp. W335]MDT0635043.1 hypothetical protein [Salinisphaera sp. W335]
MGAAVSLDAQRNSFEVEGWPLIPPGEYLLTYHRYELAFMFNTAKLFAHFQIADGEHKGARLYAAYRVKAIKRKTKRGGQFTLSKTHKLFIQLATLVNSPVRPDRPSLDCLRGCLIRGRVVTVKGPNPHKPRPEAAHYSRVDELLSIEAGST